MGYKYYPIFNFSKGIKLNIKSLGFASIDDKPLSVDMGSFASLDAEDNSVDVQNDGYIHKNKKTSIWGKFYNGTRWYNKILLEYN